MWSFGRQRRAAYVAVIIGISGERLPVEFVTFADRAEGERWVRERNSNSATNWTHWEIAELRDDK